MTTAIQTKISELARLTGGKPFSNEAIQQLANGFATLSSNKLNLADYEAEILATLALTEQTIRTSTMNDKDLSDRIKQIHNELINFMVSHHRIKTAKNAADFDRALLTQAAEARRTIKRAIAAREPLTLDMLRDLSAKHANVLAPKRLPKSTLPIHKVQPAKKSKRFFDSMKDWGNQFVDTLTGAFSSVSSSDDEDTHNQALYRVGASLGGLLMRLVTSVFSAILGPSADSKLKVLEDIAEPAMAAMLSRKNKKGPRPPHNDGNSGDDNDHGDDNDAGHGNAGHSMPPKKWSDLNDDSKADILNTVLPSVPATEPLLPEPDPFEVEMAARLANLKKP